MPNYDWHSDTDPKALDVFLAQKRKMSASEKIAAVFQLNQMLWHRLDRETMLRVYGWFPPGVAD